MGGEIRKAVTEVGALVAAGLVPAAGAEVLEQVTQAFRLRITPEMQGAIAAAEDGVARQFLPDAAELAVTPDQLADPIGDGAHLVAPGLTHRYPDRAILAVTQACEVYCRFCFRRAVVGAAGPLPAAGLQAALDHLAATPAIREVILTGGDPLTLSERRLVEVLDRLEAIVHLDLIRIHTRVPVVAPGRITPALARRLGGGRVPVWMVVHTNHAAEMTEAGAAALRALAGAGVPLLSQSVLLRGVNDSAAALEALFRGLLRRRVKPYYLHHCDLARGAGHFRTTIAEGMALMAALRGRISGTALPAYVIDIPGGHGKVPVAPDWVVPDGPGRWRLRDPWGGWHAYADPDR